LKTQPPPPNKLIISSKKSNENLEIEILFIAVEGPGNNLFEEDTPVSTALRARVVGYTPGDIYGLYRKGGHIYFEGYSLDW